MIYKKHIIALLLTTGLSGCGGGGGNSGPSNGGGNNNNSNNAHLPSQNSSISKIESLDIPKTLEEGKANTANILSNSDTLVKKAEVLAAWNLISNKNTTKPSDLPPADQDNYTSFQQKLLEFQYMLQNQALKAVPPALDLNKSYDSVSWKEMADDIKKGKKMQFRLRGIDDFENNAVLADILGTAPALTGPKGELDTPKKRVMDLYNLYHGYGNIVPKTLTINSFVNSKINAISTSSFDLIRQQLLDTRQFTIDIVKTVNIKSIVTEVAKTALFSISHEKASLVGPLNNDFFTLSQAYTLSTQKIIRDFMTQKSVMLAMIKSGQFKGLFDYIVGEVDPLSGQVIISLEEFNNLTAQSLAADITPSTMGRSVRRGVAGVDGSQLQVNGVSAGKIDMALPVSIHLKGKIDGSKSTAGTSGTVAYKLGNTVLGITQAYANTGEGFEVDSTQSETSLAVSHSVGPVFLEGQVGYIGTENVHNADMTGTCYQLSVGVDTEYVSPFVQVVYRDFGRINDTSAYVGAEVSIDKLTMDSYSLETHLTAKIGYDSHTAFTGSLEWSGSLNLNSGLSFKADLTLGTNEGSTFGLNASLTR